MRRYYINPIVKVYEMRVRTMMTVSPPGVYDEVSGGDQLSNDRTDIWGNSVDEDDVIFW